MLRIEDHRLGGRVGEQLVPSRDFYWFCQSGQSGSNGQSGPVRGVKGRDGDINGPFMSEKCRNPCNPSYNPNITQ